MSFNLSTFNADELKKAAELLVAWAGQTLPIQNDKVKIVMNPRTKEVFLANWSNRMVRLNGKLLEEIWTCGECKIQYFRSEKHICNKEVKNEIQMS